MNRRKKTLSILVVAVLAFLAGPLLWPPGVEHIEGLRGKGFALLLVSGLDALGFAVGVTFLIDGWPLVKKFSSESRSRMILLYLSVAWLLIFWWPQDTIYLTIGDEIEKVFYILLVFHIISLLAALTVSVQTIQLLRRIVSSNPEPKSQVL